MLATALFSLLLAASARSEIGNDSFTLIESRELADGNTIHRIQEHADELPELLSIPELDSTEKIPELDSTEFQEKFQLLEANEEEVLVPIDAQGDVLPAFKHLLKPHVVEISREQILRMNNSRAKDGLVIHAQPPSVIASPKEEEDREMETAGADYDEAVIPDSRLPIPKDYENSKEKDPEVETGDDGLREEELEKIEMEIEKRTGAEELPQEVLEDISAITRDAGKELEKEIKKEDSEEEADIGKAAKEILAVVSDDVVSEEKEVEEETKKEEVANTEEEEIVDKEEIQKATKEILALVGGVASWVGEKEVEKELVEPNKEEIEESEKTKEKVEPVAVFEKKEKDEKKEEENGDSVVKGAAEGAKVLEGGNVESLEEEEPEPEHRPSRPLRGEVIFRRSRPDSAPSHQHLSYIFFTMLFICFW